MKAVTCAFTGHRPKKLPWGENEDDNRCAELKKRIAREIIAAHNRGYRRFVCGMANGADMYFCEAVQQVRDNLFPDIELEAAVPCDTQSDSWSEGERERYRHALRHCDTVTYVSHEYSPTCMMKRNRYMVDQASLLIAVYAGVESGTMKTVLYAMRSGVETVIIDPETF